MQTIGLGDLLDAAMERPPEPAPLCERHAVEQLKAAAARYALGNPHRVGDLVTPASDAPLRGIGEPHVVVEINEYDDPDFTQTADIDNGDGRFGRRIQVRVATMGPYNSTLMYWMEAWMLVPWTPSDDADTEIHTPEADDRH